jgi:hypothetical protein
MKTTTCLVLLVAVAVLPAFAADPVMVAQERDRPAGEGDRPAAERDMPPAGAEMDEMMRQMGMGPQEAMMMKLLGQGNMDPMMMLMLMGAMGGGGIDEDVIGPMMFMRMLSGATAAPAQPVVLLADNTLIIVDAGTVYKVNVATMAVMDTVTYKPQAAQANPLATLLPLLMTFRQARAAPPEETAIEAPALPGGREQ